MTFGLVISCEHAANRVPRAYAQLFASRAAQAALNSHRGFDPGALAVARRLCEVRGEPLYATRVSRLLIEPNRSLGHPSLFSRFTAHLSREDKARLETAFYLPHRTRVEQALRKKLERCDVVLHISVHSFTPVLEGELRRADLGLLYDPSRRRERALAEHWQRALSERLPALRIRRNYPYRGASDGFTTFLRRRLGARYLGFEIELNQALITTSSASPRDLADALHATLSRVAR